MNIEEFERRMETASPDELLALIEEFEEVLTQEKFYSGWFKYHVELAKKVGYIQTLVFGARESFAAQNNGVCRVSHKEVSRRLNMAKSTEREATKELANIRLIEPQMQEYKTDLINVLLEDAPGKNWVKTYDRVCREVGYIPAMVYGVIEGYTKMSSGYCHATQRTMADRLSISVNALRKAIEELIEAKYLIEFKTNKRTESNIYIVKWPEEIE